MKASITLEGSIIYPLIIFISIMLIIHNFYMHDIVAVKADIYRILMEDTSKYNDNPNLSFSISNIKKRLTQKCILPHNFDISFDTDSYTLNLYDSDNFSVHISFSNFERCNFIRKYYTILSLIRKDE